MIALEETKIGTDQVMSILLKSTGEGMTEEVFMLKKTKKGPKSEREQWGSKWGFILACIGSAVGMGNVWMFPYRVGQFGGAAFLIPYLLFVVIIGYTGVVGEISFGRAMRKGPAGSFRKAFLRRGKPGKLGEAIGMIPVIGSFALAIGYSVVIGWILKFTLGSVTGSVYHNADSSAYFGSIAGSFQSVGWQLLGLALVFIIMAAGVSAGIEKVNKIMMPLFFLLFVVLGIRVATLPGAVDGYRFMFIPKWSALADPKTWVYALGQAFFSLSLAGNGTLIYGSYLSEDENVMGSAKNIAIFDTLAAILSALVILPSVFVYGLDPASGPPLMFITMPEVFKSMPGGMFFMIIFFVAVLSAGISSLINLFEAPIATLQEKFHLTRFQSVAGMIGMASVVGICIEGIVGGWMDVVSIYVCPLGALLAAIMFYWVCGPDFAREAAQKGCQRPIGKWFEPMTRYVFCGLTMGVFILGIFFGGIG